MFFILNKNVYLVKGNTKGCIYDFNTSKLYSLNNKLMRLVDKVNNGHINNDSLESNIKNILNQLLKLKILILSKVPIKRDINEIKSHNENIDFAWIEVTNQCNLRCIHCYNESDINCTSVMSLENFKNVINNLVELNVPKIQIIGGEPFFYKNILKEMIDYTLGKFKFIEIFTNGTLITKEWVDYISRNKINIALSVYSYDKNEHDKVTGIKGSWEKTNATINLLKQNNINYRVCNILMKKINIGEKNTDLYELNNHSDVVRMSGRANIHLLSDELIKKKLITQKTFKYSLKKELSSLLISGHNCFRHKIYISSDMKVFPCVMERRFKHCDINKKSKIILNKKICSFNKDIIETCNKCEYRYTCFDCRPNSFVENIYAKPWYCTYDPMTGIWADENEFISKLKNNL